MCGCCGEKCIIERGEKMAPPKMHSWTWCHVVCCEWGFSNCLISACSSISWLIVCTTICAGGSAAESWEVCCGESCSTAVVCTHPTGQCSWTHTSASCLLINLTTLVRIWHSSMWCRFYSTHFPLVATSTCCRNARATPEARVIHVLPYRPE